MARFFSVAVTFSMQISGWRQERIAILVFLGLAVVTGWITGYWSWSLVVWLLVYIFWKTIEFKTFYDWYMNGASKKSIPANQGVFESITRHVINNKNQIKKAHKRNEYLLQQFITTAQALPFATLLLNKNFEIQWVNHMAHEILNINESDANTKTAFIQLLSTGKKDQEIKLTHNAGSNKSIQVRLIEINQDRFLMVAWDISAQEALQKSRKAFVANASHELRTPLTVISGYLEMLQSSEHVNDDWSMAIDQAKDQANRMVKIIDGMLKLSKIEHGRAIQSKDDEIPMPELINGLFNDIKNGPNSHNHILEAEINSALWIKGDSSEITSICLNLMHNATIHTPDGTRIIIKWFENKTEQPIFGLSIMGPVSMPSTYRT